jgi:hypothetical protein
LVEVTDPTLLIYAVGAGVVGLYGYLYRMENKISRNIEKVCVQVDCLKALHLRYHPDDEKLITAICKGDQIP